MASRSRRSCETGTQLASDRARIQRTRRRGAHPERRASGAGTPDPRGAPVPRPLELSRTLAPSRAMRQYYCPCNFGCYQRSVTILFGGFTSAAQ